MCVGANTSLLIHTLSGFVRDLFCCLFLIEVHAHLCILTPSVFCIVYVCGVFQKAGRGGSYLSASFMFSPQPFLFVLSLCLCVCGKVCGRFHGTVPTLHSTSLPSLPSSPSFFLNLSFHPVQTVCRCCPPPSPSRLP